MPYVVEHDPSKCDGCLSCVKACGEAHNLPEGVANCQIFVLEVKKGDEVQKTYAYFSCMHCRRPQCAEACPTGAMRREKDVVLLEEALCVGCMNCVYACPWGAPVFNPNTGKVSKCDLCIDRILAGKKPYCVEACPNGALVLKEKKAPAKKKIAKKPVKKAAPKKAEDAQAAKAGEAASREEKKAAPSAEGQEKAQANA